MPLLIILFILMQLIIFGICALEEQTLNIFKWDVFVLGFEIITFITLCSWFIIELYKQKREEKSIIEKEKDEIPSEWI